MALAKMPKIAIDKIIRDKHDMLICGPCQEIFKISGISADQTAIERHALFINQTNKNSGPLENIGYFTLVLKEREFKILKIILELSDSVEEITINASDGANGDYNEISKYVGFNWFNILKTVKPFGEIWHQIIYNIDYNLIENLDHEILPEADRALYFRIRELRLHGKDGVSPISFETRDGLAWRIGGNLPEGLERIDICLDHHRLLSLEEDSENSGYPAKNSKGIEFSINKNDYRESIPAIVLRAAGGRVLAFRFFDLADYFEPKYKFYFDSVEPVLRGWAVDETLPGRLFSVDILIDGVLYYRADNSGGREDLRWSGITCGQGGFLMESPLKYLKAGEHEFALRMPDGTVSEPIKAVAPGWPKRAIRDYSKFKKRISIIIPAYNDPEELARCLQSVVEHTEGKWRVIVIDDCSTHPGMKDVLAQYANNEKFILLRNAENLGFPGTVDVGLVEAGQDDVVFLNSDTRVTPGWLQGLLSAASSQPKIATVTAMSDRAGAFSAPELGFRNPLPKGIDEIEYARAFRDFSQALYAHAPTGNGFCMYINREALNECGLMDKDVFMKAYGEENDFCMRTLRCGWKHLIDDTTYIYHEHAITFGGEARREMVGHALKVIFARYPEYRHETDFFEKDTKMRMARYNARCALYMLRKKMGLDIGRVG